MSGRDIENNGQYADHNVLHTGLIFYKAIDLEYFFVK